MKLLLKASLGLIDSDGVIISKDLDPEETIEKIDCLEIDGVKFDIIIYDKEIEILLENEKLSDLIIPNYHNKFVFEIKPKKESGKFTAKLLNKFLRKFNKKFPNRIILIKSIEKL